MTVEAIGTIRPYHNITTFDGKSTRVSRRHDISDDYISYSFVFREFVHGIALELWLTAFKGRTQSTDCLAGGSPSVAFLLFDCTPSRLGNRYLLHRFLSLSPSLPFLMPHMAC